MAMTSTKYLFILVSLLPLLLSGCGQRERKELDNLEQTSAATVAKFLSFHELRHPGARITNAIQAFAEMELRQPHRTHPFVLQERFREFGNRSGFKNSIYEKYVPVSLNLTNNTIQGEILLISAEPFLDRNKQTVRMAIWKAGKQDYRISRLEENRVQKIFKDADRSIPKSAAMPPAEAPPGDYKLSYPPWTMVRMFFENLAEDYGPGRAFWIPAMFLSGFIILVVVIFLFIWIGRRGRH